MSIPIKTERTPDFNLVEREWLRRIRGTTLANLAESANQMAFRRSFVTVSKSFMHGQERINKADGAGYTFFDWDRIEASGTEYYHVDIIHSHPAATELGCILTFIAPPDMRDNPSTPYTARIRMQLIDASGGHIDPPTSAYAIDMTHANGGIPAPSIVSGGQIEGFESSDGSINHSGTYPDLAAKIVRKVCYLDRGSSAGVDDYPRRLQYGTAAGTSQHLILKIRTDYAVILNATVFEIPKITT